MLGANANNIGVTLGYYYPSFFISEEDRHDAEMARRHIFELLLYFAIAQAIISLATLTLYRQAPIFLQKKMSSVVVRHI